MKGNDWALWLYQGGEDEEKNNIMYAVFIRNGTDAKG